MKVFVYNISTSQRHFNNSLTVIALFTLVKHQEIIEYIDHNLTAEYNNKAAQPNKTNKYKFYKKKNTRFRCELFVEYK